jgi:DNA invertase Pin-like site-specific DNA recombinase
MTTAIYLRQSYAPNGDILAVSRQREDVARLCRERGWLDTIEYQDNDFSATNGKTRPKYQRMLTDIPDGKISAVAVWDLDRLYRQPRELEDLIDLADAKGLLLATVTGDADLSTDNGRLYARIKGAVGKSEIERKAARQKRAARQKADSGEPQWKHAFGYVVGEHKPECLPGCKSHHHQLDPVTAPLVKQAYAAILAGSSLNDICRLFNDAGEPVPQKAAQRRAAHLQRRDRRQRHVAGVSGGVHLARSPSGAERARPCARPEDRAPAQPDWCIAVRKRGLRWLPVGDADRRQANRIRL